MLQFNMYILPGEKKRPLNNTVKHTFPYPSCSNTSFPGRYQGKFTRNAIKDLKEVLQLRRMVRVKGRSRMSAQAELLRDLIT